LKRLVARNARLAMARSKTARHDRLLRPRIPDARTLP
jgi:hypothetical protein